jgi:hypothetical protein
MDEETRTHRVAVEIVEAGILGVPTSPHVSRVALTGAFLSVANSLGSAQVGAFTRSLESAQESSPEAVALREKVAADMHRDGAGIVTAGGHAAMIAYVLGGKGPGEARSEVGWELRSTLSQDGLVGRSSPEMLLSTANRNYVFAASALVGLGQSETPLVYASLGAEILGVVQFAVAAVAEASASEEARADGG